MSERWAERAREIVEQWRREWPDDEWAPLVSEFAAALEQLERETIAECARKTALQRCRDCDRALAGSGKGESSKGPQS